MHRKWVVGLICVVWLLVGVSRSALAQDEAGVIINYANTEDEGEQLGVELFFLLENDSTVVADDFGSAYILLDDGSQYEATISDSNVPYYITLVLDVSGSQSGVEDDMRQAAIGAVNAAPAGAQFAVMSFNETISLLQDFTDDRARLVSAINSVQVENKGTCLYDVALTALEALDQIAADAPQRAMLLFTDGRDEFTRGQGDTCSENTAAQLIALASDQDSTIPIHTIGLSGSDAPILSDGLSNLSLATGGLSVVVDEEMNLSSYFSDVMSDFGTQWVATSEVWTPAGTRTATLFVTLQDGTLVRPDTSFFVADRTYAPPVEENDRAIVPTIRVDHFEYDRTNDQFLSTIYIDRPQSVGNLRIELWNIQSNQEVGDPILEDVFSASENDVLIPTTDLEPLSVYALRIYAFNKLGIEIRDEFDTALRAEHVFQYVPPSTLTFSMDGLAINEDNNQLIADLSIDNGQAITQYSGRIIEQSTNTTAYEFGPLQRFGDAIYVPLELQENGRYTFNVGAYDAEGTILATATYQFEYTAPDNIFVSAYNALIANPLLFAFFAVLALILMLIEALILVFVIRRRYASQQQEEEEEEEQESRLTGNVSGLPFAKLRIEKSLASNFVGNEFEINYVPFSIGREGADLDIPGDRGISREHAVITYDDKTFKLTSMSKTGTIVNDSTIPERELVELGEEERTTIKLGRGTQVAFITEVRNLEDEDDEGENASSLETPEVAVPAAP